MHLSNVVRYTEPSGGHRFGWHEVAQRILRRYAMDGAGVQLAGGEFGVCRLVQSQRIITLHAPFDSLLGLAWILAAMFTSRPADVILIHAAIALHRGEFVDT